MTTESVRTFSLEESSNTPQLKRERVRYRVSCANGHFEEGEDAAETQARFFSRKPSDLPSESESVIDAAQRMTRTTRLFMLVMPVAASVALLVLAPDRILGALSVDLGRYAYLLGAALMVVGAWSMDRCARPGTKVLSGGPAAIASWAETSSMRAIPAIVLCFLPALILAMLAPMVIPIIASEFSSAASAAHELGR